MPTGRASCSSPPAPTFRHSLRRTDDDTDRRDGFGGRRDRDSGGVAQIAVSGGDALATISTPAAARQIVWADDPSRLLTSLEGLTALAVSPDGRRAAGVSLDQTGSDIWIVDLARDSARRSLSAARTSSRCGRPMAGCCSARGRLAVWRRFVRRIGRREGRDFNPRRRATSLSGGSVQRSSGDRHRVAGRSNRNPHHRSGWW